MKKFYKLNRLWLEFNTLTTGYFMKLGFYFCFALLGLFGNEVLLEEKRIVIVVPSYKNEKWVKQNLSSIFNQDYVNYRVIYIDDYSPDNTVPLIKSLVNEWNFAVNFTLIENKERKGAMRNLYEAIHSCDDEEIVVTVDGDDWLAHDQVLNHLNKVYSNKDRPVWITHGSYRDSKGNPGMQNQITDSIIERNAFRGKCRVSHLRTFYAWLFKKILIQDLMYEGKFFEMAWDLAMMFPMLEMAGHRQLYIPEVLYIYNVQNPISDFVKNPDYQMKLDRYIHKKRKYCPLL